MRIFCSNLKSESEWRARRARREEAKKSQKIRQITLVTFQVEGEGEKFFSGGDRR